MINIMACLIDNIVYTRLNGKHGFVLKMCSLNKRLVPVIGQHIVGCCTTREVCCLGRTGRKIFFYTRNLTACIQDE